MVSVAIESDMIGLHREKSGELVQRVSIILPNDIVAVLVAMIMFPFTLVCVPHMRNKGVDLCGLP